MNLLFKDIEHPETLIQELSGTTKSYAIGDEILSEGDRLDSLAVILQGEVHLLRYDYWGHQHLLTHLSEGDLFGESYALAREELRVTVVAQSPCVILFLPLRTVLAHEALRENLIFILARKNLFLTAKLHHITKRSSREKLLSFLSEQAGLHGNHFTIPYNRQQLADYLAVDRSALSALLSRLQKEGLLTFRGPRFTLLRNEMERNENDLSS